MHRLCRGVQTEGCTHYWFIFMSYRDKCWISPWFQIFPFPWWIRTLRKGSCDEMEHVIATSECCPFVLLALWEIIYKFKCICRFFFFFFIPSLHRDVCYGSVSHFPKHLVVIEPSKPVFLKSFKKTWLVSDDTRYCTIQAIKKMLP